MKYILVIGLLFTTLITACGESDREAAMPSLHSPYKMNFAEVATEQTAGFQCPSPPAEPLQDMKFKSFYKKSDPARAEVNRKAQKKYEKQTENLRKFENELILMANRYLKSGKQEDAAAQCVLDWLHQWAAGDAFLGKTNAQGSFVRQWGLAVVASAFAQIQSSPQLDDRKKQVVTAWLLNVAHSVKNDYTGETTTSVRPKNNHLYWAAWAVTMTAAALDQKELYTWGVNNAKYALLAQMKDDGTLPLEMNRGKRALHYHVFALTPLMLIAETATRNGENLYELKDGLLHVAAKRVFDGMKDPAEFAKQTGVEQEPITNMSNEHFAWLEIYNSRFPDPEMEAWLQAHRPIFSRRAGGDVQFLFRQPETN